MTLLLDWIFLKTVSDINIIDIIFVNLVARKSCYFSSYINISMLYYDKIDESQRTDVNKTNESQKCITCNFYFFLKY